jgi:hypothetical protein
MESETKKEIVANYKLKKERESHIIKNTGLELPLGDETIIIKELPWLDAGKFEKKVYEVFKNITDLMKKELITTDGNEAEKNQGIDIPSNINADTINGFLDLIINKLLDDDLLQLAKLITKGKCTKTYIIETNATKNQVIQLVVEGVKLNYSYLKNALSLVQFLG